MTENTEKEMVEPEKKLPPMRYCFNCGCEVGRSFYKERFQSCGQGECQAAEREAHAYEHEQAHEQLDRDMGYY